MDKVDSGKKFLVIGSGYSISHFRDNILNFIKEHQCITVGVNHMTSLCHPKYHLWTNYQQFCKFRQCINEESVLVLGEKLSKLIDINHKGQTIMLKTEESDKYKIDNEIIFGNYRTAGCLAIMFSYMLGASDIFVVGMDGYTFYDERSVKSGRRNQHCYGIGFTDDADWSKCVKKDKDVLKGLREIKKSGVNFKIITPTKFNEFFDNSFLGIDS